MEPREEKEHHSIDLSFDLGNLDTLNSEQLAAVQFHPDFEAHEKVALRVLKA